MDDSLHDLGIASGNAYIRIVRENTSWDMSCLTYPTFLVLIGSVAPCVHAILSVEFGSDDTVIVFAKRQYAFLCRAIAEFYSDINRIGYFFISVGCAIPI